MNVLLESRERMQSVKLDSFKKLRLVFCFISSLLFSLGAASAEHWKQDVAYFENNRSIYVYVDWQSFIDQGIPPNQIEPFSLIARSAIKRWNEIGGANVQMLWKGRRDYQPTPKNGSEIVLRMSDCVEFSGDGQKTAVATASATKGRGGWVTFYRDEGSDIAGVGCDVRERINWHFGWSLSRGDNQVGAHYVLIHELGHALGLIDHTPTTVTRYSALSTNGYAMWPQRFGPWSDDINRLHALYGPRIGVSQLHFRKSTDYGNSWNLVELLDRDKFMTTTQPIGVAKTGSKYVVAYTLPVWGFLKTIYGDERDGFTDGSVLWSNSARGVSVSANGNTTLMAYVDAYGDNVEGGDDTNFQIRLLRSTNLGKTWSNLTIPASYTAETPTIKYFGDNTWLLAYSLFGNSKQTQRPPIRFPIPIALNDTNNNFLNYNAQFGRLIVRVSTDNGNTWSQELTPDAAGRWSLLLDSSNQFASDPGWRIASEIGVVNANGILIIQASTVKTEPRFSNQNYKWGGVTGSSAQLVANENIFSAHGPVLVMGTNVLLQAHTTDYVTRTRVSAWGGNTSQLKFGSISAQVPAIEVDPFNNHFYMLTVENPWLNSFDSIVDLIYK